MIRVNPFRSFTRPTPHFLLKKYVKTFEKFDPFGGAKVPF